MRRVMERVLRHARGKLAAQTGADAFRDPVPRRCGGPKVDRPPGIGKITGSAPLARATLIVARSPCAR